MSPELVKRYSAPVPRYTSYPTAPHFSADVGPDTYAAWLAALPAAATPVALHAHPVLQLAVLVLRVLHQGGAALRARGRLPRSRSMPRSPAIARLMPTEHEVTHIHWGGGSPNILSCDDIAALADAQRRALPHRARTPSSPSRSIRAGSMKTASPRSRAPA